MWAPELPQEGRFVEEADSPKRGLRSALAFPITGGGRPRGIIELLGSKVLHPDDELLYIVWLIGRRIGQFADRRRDRRSCARPRSGSGWQPRPGAWACWIGMCWPTRAGALVRWPRSTATLRASSTSSYEEFLERVHPDDRGRVRSTLDAAVAAGAPYELEFRIVRPAGDIRWVHAKGRVHRDEKGVPARVLGVSLDITEQKQAEAGATTGFTPWRWTAHAEAAERERISRELHDRVAHSMGVAHQSLQLYEALAEKDPVRATASYIRLRR